MYQVLRSGEPELMAQIPEELLEAAAVDAEHREILREAGPEILHGGSSSSASTDVGGDLMIAAESGRRYGQADLALAQEIARRAALAVDNARLYEEAQKEIAEREWAQEATGLQGPTRYLAGCRRRHYRAGPHGTDHLRQRGCSQDGRLPLRPGVHGGSTGEVWTRFEVLDEEGHPFPPEDFRGGALAGEEGAEEVLSLRVQAAERWAIVKAMPIFGEQGRVRMAVNIFRDITEAKRAEDTLRRVTEAERSRIARDLHDGVLQDLSYTAAAMGLIMLEVDDAELERAPSSYRCRPA